MSIRQVVLSVLLGWPLLVNAIEFQYAYFSETEVQGKNREVTIILSFNTDPGVPITVVESSTNYVALRHAVYANFFKQMNWTDANESDPLYVLNRLGKQGWEVIHARKEKSTTFVTKDPSVEELYLLKKTK
jgi:hypothetical protein